MKFFKIVLGLIVCIFSTSLYAQTNTITSGTWSDASVWSAGVPGNGTITANVYHPLEVNANIAIGISGTGVFNIFQSVTDFPGGTAYTLEVGNNGTLDVQGGTSYFNAAASFSGNNSMIRIRSGATLILNGDVALQNGTTIIIDAGGTLIINGDVNSNIQAPNSFRVEGTVQINGSYNSSGDVDVIGNGEFFTSGGINTSGGPTGTVFGSPNNCPGPCSGQNLCFAGADNVIVNQILTSDQFLCSGATASPLTGDAVASASYQWQSSIVSATSGFNDIPDIPNAQAQNYDPGTPAQTTWYRRRATVGTCSGLSTAKVITIIPAASWIGGTSPGNWNDGSNWCGGVVPTIDTDVVIPAGILFNPIVNAAALCRNLTISSSASLTVNSGQQINISGNLTNNGTVTVAGIMNFNGTTAQSIGGSGFGSYVRIIVNNTSGATPAFTIPSNGLNIATTLTLTSGKVNLSNANLTVGTSTNTTPGSVVTSAGGWAYNGNLTRWLVGNVNSALFPIGTSADYRPVFITNSNISTIGTIRVSHTAVNGSSSVAFNDNGTAVEVRTNSFWTVSAGSTLATATGTNFTIRTDGTGLGTVGDVAHLRLTHVGNQAAGMQGTNGGTVTNPQVIRTAVPLLNLSGNFYWGSINGTVTPLPVELISFTAVLKFDIVELKWSTASELNNDHFTIERSTDLENFDVVATIPGNGTSNVIHHYNTLDPSPVYGRSYYRLKQTDYDGKYSYSDVRLIDYEGPKFSSLRAYPNPLTGANLTIVITGLKDQTTVPVVIYNVQGQIVFEQTFQVETPGVLKQEIEITERLRSGLYIIKAGQTLQLMQKLVVE
jgi:hypothetical protein